MTTSTTPPHEEIWRSKLGTNYSKEFMDRNEANLLKEMNAIRHLPYNQKCADCSETGTVWASVNLGVFLCLQCGSHHRSLGTHISCPKGCNGTYLWGPDEIEHMREIGNKRAAEELYGNYIPPGISKNDPNCQKWKQYLTDKYVNKKYAPTKHHSAPAGGVVHATTPPLSPRTTILDNKKHLHPKLVSPNLPKLSPKSIDNRRLHPKSPNLPKPSIDLITFDNFSPKSPQSPVKPKATITNHHDSPATGQDFFAQFGL